MIKIKIDKLLIKSDLSGASFIISNNYSDVKQYLLDREVYKHFTCALDLNDNGTFEEIIVYLDNKKQFRKFKLLFPKVFEMEDDFLEITYE